MNLAFWFQINHQKDLFVELKTTKISCFRILGCNEISNLKYPWIEV